MRTKPLLLTIALATSTLAAGPAVAQAAAAVQAGAAAQVGSAAQVGAVTTAPPAVTPPAVIPPVDAESAQPAAVVDDEVVRSVYIMTGAMAGYMFAVMPVTMTAVTAAMISGAASMWAYDYVLGPAAKANQADGR